MRPIEEIRERWRLTQTVGGSPGELRRAVKNDGPSNPCVAGLRSVCWKAFLLSRDDGDSWIEALRDGRGDYTRRRDKLLRYIKHPGALAELTVDPLADEPNSPWNMARQDEAIRAEIQQDVQRLPDEANYHDERIQTLILDVLFIYCKANPDRGGYRQGMHELLAPIVHVLEEDGVDRAAIADADELDDTLVDLVDAAFLEHDAYLLFSNIMENAQSFYAVPDAPPESAPRGLEAGRRQEQSSSIVERSRFIHEVCLQKVDPELASHLISVEVLPQIFLIRWIRLLFSREFPYVQFLVLWDNIFAIDPSLELVDLICVAMLTRIRWQLLQADYSVCLQLLLKYPPPAADALGPRAFVEDAEYLRSHMNAAGGASLIKKYTGRTPVISKTPEASRPSTPSFRSFTSLRQRGFGARQSASSLSIGQQGGVEALFQGAAKGAKGVLERGERLGINQAVRDAMGEIRRNMQGLNETRYLVRPSREALGDSGAAAAAAMEAMEKRNRQLASMLDETVASLGSISAASLEDKVKSLELVEIAAAKIQFVKVYLEDPTMEVPLVEPSGPSADAAGAQEQEKTEGAREAKEATMAAEEPSGAEESSEKKGGPLNGDVAAAAGEATRVKAAEDGRTAAPAEPPGDVTPPDVAAADSATPSAEGSDGPTSGGSRAAARLSTGPARSTLAQSSFSWMLEPEKASTASPAAGEAAAAGSRSPAGAGAAHRKRPTNRASRERNAFLFGEAGDGEAEHGDPLGKDNIFGMEQLRGAKG